MRNSIWFLVVALLLSGCLAGNDIVQQNPGDVVVSNALAAQDSTVVRVQPAEQTLEVGNVTTLSIEVDNVTNLVAAEMEVRFDPTVLQVQDSDPARGGIQIQPDDSFVSGFVALNDVDNSSGTARYAVTQLAPFSPANGSGRLAAVTFQAVAQGSSDISLATVNLSDEAIQLISVVVNAGRIVVTGGETLPTSTSTATLVPGQPTNTPTSTPTSTNTPVPGVSPVPVTSTPLPTFTPTPISATATPPPTFTPTPVPPTATPVPLSNQAPPGATVGFCYRVQPGETLHSIAKYNGLDPHYLNTVNDLSPSGYVKQNQIIFVPTQPGYGPNVYSLQPGETLAIIAERCRLPVTLLAKTNNLDPNANLQTGHVLIIPIPPFAPPSRYGYPLPPKPERSENK